MGDGSFELETLIADYERFAVAGVKLVSDISRLEEHSGVRSSTAAVVRLRDAEFVICRGDAVVLQRPDDLALGIDEGRKRELQGLYDDWLRAGAPASEELLYGEAGYWQHWWNQLRESELDGASQLLIDVVVPDDGAFAGRNWLSEFDREIRSYVITQDLIRSRAIVPPDTLGSLAEPLIELCVESGLEVRVLSSEARFVIYNHRVAVLSEGRGANTPEAYRATSDRAVVRPLRSFFELLWQSATPWQVHGSETHQVLRLLAEGCTDKAIAAELNISARTVNRRVAEAMATYDAKSRFELGARYAGATFITRAD